MLTLAHFGFEKRPVRTSAGIVMTWQAGSGPALLLLHGFPQTSLMWRGVAPLMAQTCRVVAADLPGYGESDGPTDREDVSAMSKRRMAATLVETMRLLGHERFAIIGHDRGGRVAYRAALDHPGAVDGVALLDVVSTLDVWERADARTMLSFWPFSLLAQPAPLPERLIASAPEAVVDSALDGWGTRAAVFSPDVREAYVAALRNPDQVHMICQEYRAAASVDRELDRVDLDAGRRIGCPMLVLWSASGGLATWYGELGGPLGLWRRFAWNVRGAAIEGGHFFPEEHPAEVSRRLIQFLSTAQRRE